MKLTVKNLGPIEAATVDLSKDLELVGNLSFGLKKRLFYLQKQTPNKLLIVLTGQNNTGKTCADQPLPLFMR